MPGTRASLRDSWEQTSWDETRTWEDEDDQFEGSFADEDEEEAFHLAETQLNEALASERNARRTVAQARAIMHETSRAVVGGYYPQGANKKGSEAGKGKGKGTWQEPRQSWPSDWTVFKHFDESSWNATPQTDATISKTLPEMRFSRSRSWQMSEESRTQKL